MQVTFRTDSETRTASGTSEDLLKDVCVSAGLPLNTFCGGHGVCQGCRVQLEQGTFRIGREILQVEAGHSVETLACKCSVVSDTADVYVPNISLVEQAPQIVDEFSPMPGRLDPELKKEYLRIPSATLECPYSDRRRIEQQLDDRIGGVACTFPLAILKCLPHVLQQENGRVSVTLGRERTHWTAIDIEPGDTTACNFALAMDIGTIPRALESLAGLAGVLAHSGQPEQALELAGMVQSHPAVENNTKSTIKPILADLRAKLPPDVVKAAVERGKVLELEATVAEIVRATKK